jgi:transketolase
MTLVAPCDSVEAVALLKQSLDWHGPIYFRLGGPDTRVVALGAELPKIGCGRLLLPPGRILIVSTGTITVEAWAAADLLLRRGIGCGLLHLHTIKPFDERLLTSVANSVDLLVTVEEHTLTGGLGSALLEALNDANHSFHRPVLRLGLPDRFVSNYGSRQQLLQLYGLDAPSIADRTEQFYSGRKPNTMSPS